MRSWREVNWTEVLVLSIVFLVLVAVASVLVALWVAKANARSEARIVQIQQEFLRNEYARLASESALYQDEFREIIRDVAQMAKAMSAAVQSPDWDPQEQLERLDRFEAQIHSLEPAPGT